MLALAYGVYSVVDLLSFGRDHFQRTFTDAITTVEIHNSAGSVRIDGASGSEIAIDGSIRRGLRQPNHTETITGDRLVLDAKCPTLFTNMCNLNYAVRVPAGVAVVIRSNGGGVRVSDVSGPIDAASSGGGVRVFRTSGDLRLRSSGGGISGEGVRSANVDASSSGGGIRLAFAAAPTSVVVDSSGGGVTVELPNTTDAYQLRVSSSGGGVSTPVRSDPTSSRIIDAHSSGGGVTIRYPN
ncbi:MAG TPA: hypothetical protein VM282_04990 [Acidimicrobiales bacterium]|nr:hypothetical protein [Acidimicrobiales bacterium]